MSDEDFIKLAIESAKQAESKGGCAIGAVIVKDNKVIAVGESVGYVIRDPTNHALILPITRTPLPEIILSRMHIVTHSYSPE